MGGRRRGVLPAQLAGLAGGPPARRGCGGRPRAAARAAGTGLGDVGAALGGAPRLGRGRAGGAAGAALGRVLADLFPQARRPGVRVRAGGRTRGQPDPPRLPRRPDGAPGATGPPRPGARRRPRRSSAPWSRWPPVGAASRARDRCARRPSWPAASPGRPGPCGPRPATRPLVRTLPQVVRADGGVARPSERPRGAGGVRSEPSPRWRGRPPARLASPQQCAGAYRAVTARSTARYHRQLPARGSRASRPWRGAPLGARR